MRGRSWAWLVALTAGTSVVAATTPAVADDPWGVSDHSGAGVSGTLAPPAATAATPAPAARPPVTPPRTTAGTHRATATSRAAPATSARVTAVVRTTPRPPPTTPTTPTTRTPTPTTPTRSTADPTPTGTAAPDPEPPDPEPPALPTSRLDPQPSAPTGSPPSTAASSPGPSGIDVGWGGSPPPSVTVPPSSTTSTIGPTSSTGSVGVPPVTSTDGDVDLDLTATVVAADPTWNRAASGTDLGRWTQTLSALAAARAGRPGASYLRVSVPLRAPAGGASAVAPATFQQVWGSFRSVARRVFPQARLVLTVEAGRDVPAALAPYWPGDDLVDVVGVLARVASPDEARVVESLSDPRGLGAWLGFAAAHGAGVGVPDWGIDGGTATTDGTTFVRWMQAALAANAAGPGQTAGRVLYAPVVPPTGGTDPAPVTPTPIPTPTAPPPPPPTARPTSTTNPTTSSPPTTAPTTAKPRSAPRPPAVTSSGS